jgi:hypothetical protein
MKDEQMCAGKEVTEELADITQKEDTTTQSMKIAITEAEAGTTHK